MGTRSIIRFYAGSKCIAAIYQQFNGYIDGVGKELKEFCKSKKLVNGIGSDENVFNGAGCMAAQFVAKFKNRAGGLYLRSPDCQNEAYNYKVEVFGFNIKVSCQEDKAYLEEF